MRYVYVIILMIWADSIFSQDFNPYLNRNDTLISENSSQVLKTQKPSFSLEMGTVFGFSKVYGNSFGTFVSPRISYPLSKRFSISTGMTLYRNTGNYVYSPFDQSLTAGGFSGSLLFVEGAYQMNENLTLTGAAFHDINLSRKPPSVRQNSAMFNDSYKGVMMGAKYKLGDNVFIEGQVEFSNGRNPYLHSPFNRSSMSPAYHPFVD
ncbi:MAG: hypothetical protein KDC05_12335 [Bacteroidales bacterium]|nr:hypothetical protein [Bacteroidales bacterium]